MLCIERVQRAGSDQKHAFFSDYAGNFTMPLDSRL